MSFKQFKKELETRSNYGDLWINLLKGKYPMLTEKLEREQEIINKQSQDNGVQQ